MAARGDEGRELAGEHLVVCLDDVEAGDDLGRVGERPVRVDGVVDLAVRGAGDDGAAVLRVRQRVTADEPGAERHHCLREGSVCAHARAELGVVLRLGARGVVGVPVGFVDEVDVRVGHGRLLVVEAVTALVTPS